MSFFHQDFSAYVLCELAEPEKLQEFTIRFKEESGLPCAIRDIQGKTIASSGGIDVCEHFHRLHPATRHFCMKSVLFFKSGDFKDAPIVFKCRNGLREIAVPIVYKKKCIGIFVFGQFLYDIETVDIDFFRRQARRYGFDEEDYVSAVHRIPQLNRGIVCGMIDCYKHISECIARYGIAHADTTGEIPFSIQGIESFMLNQDWKDHQESSEPPIKISGRI